MGVRGEYRSDAERIAALEWQVTELTKDLNKLNGIATDVVVLKREVEGLKFRLNWVIALFGTFAVALLITAVTFALNVLAGAL